jgi:hypothetical protein
MRRLLPISMYLLQREGRFLNGHDLFIKRIGAAYHAFVDRTMRDCQQKCLEDLQSTTEFVTWSLHSGNKAGLRAVLGTGGRRGDAAPPAPVAPAGAPGALVATAAPAESAAAAQDGRVLELVENGLWSRKLADVTQDVVGLLVQQIFSGIRDHLVTSSELKMNCYGLLAIIRVFPEKLREEMESGMDADLDSFFDVAAIRSELEARRSKLESELHQMERIQVKVRASAAVNFSVSSTAPFCSDA